jgi:hypothetical protein
VSACRPVAAEHSLLHPRLFFSTSRRSSL